MRRLMLLRHGKSDWSVSGQRDIDRALATRGREAAALVSRYMAAQGLVPDKALVSNARRTRETWELVALVFGEQPSFAYEPRLYDAGSKVIAAVIEETPPEVQTLLLIGHNPGIHELAIWLAGGGENDARQRLAEKFPTAALAVLEFSSDAWTRLKPSTARLDRFVTPRALKLQSE